MILDIHTHNFKGRADEVAASAAAHGIDRFIFLGMCCGTATNQPPSRFGSSITRRRRM